MVVHVVSLNKLRKIEIVSNIFTDHNGMKSEMSLLIIIV